MASESLPPDYSVQESVRDSTNHTETERIDEDSTQLLIVPINESLVRFQTGYLGAPGERAAIEGELHIKLGGIPDHPWNRVTVSLRTEERVGSRELELYSSEMELWECPEGSSDVAPPASLPFSLPLTEDTPQCVHAPQSDIIHFLTATLHSKRPSVPTLSKTVQVHTRRFTARTSSPDLWSQPERHTADDPSTIQVEVPRSSFRVGEHIPVYVTIPPPPSDVVLERGLRLRNVQVELVREIRYPSGNGSSTSVAQPSTSAGITSIGTTSSCVAEKAAAEARVTVDSEYSNDASIGSILSRAGAACRFHSSKSVRLRLVLRHYESASPSSAATRGDSATSPGHCASITQTTVLHSITFHIHVQVNFMQSSTHTQRTTSVVIPIDMLPMAAPSPELGDDLHNAYHKKHDRPPLQTVRQDDSDPAGPYAEQSNAGPSGVLAGAPPPFEEHDAPPPFTAPQSQASSSRLPTFLESESDAYIIADDSEDSPPLVAVQFLGEGSIFGFLPSEQFDGQSDILERSSTPPPPMEMSSADPDVTEIANMVVNHPEQAMNALNRVMEESGAGHGPSEFPPPPPPAMDDPSDPPPSIDTDFRSSGRGHEEDVHLAASGPSNTASAAISQSTTNGHVHTAPPPYLVQSEEGISHATVTRPPPYADLVLPSEQ